VNFDLAYCQPLLFKYWFKQAYVVASEVMQTVVQNRGRRLNCRGSEASSVEELEIFGIHTHFSSGILTAEFTDVRTVCLQLKYLGVFIDYTVN
jgi:hypothetical protein